MWYIYTLEYYSATKIMPVAPTWRDLEIILSKLSRKDKYHDITYTWNLKHDINELIYKTETDSENRLVSVGGREEEGSRVWD